MANTTGTAVPEVRRVVQMIKVDVLASRIALLPFVELKRAEI